MLLDIDFARGTILYRPLRGGGKRAVRWQSLRLERLRHSLGLRTGSELRCGRGLQRQTMRRGVMIIKVLVRSKGSGI